ncbi:hypothetical protein Scep_021796 [Stephania cephalantha]|uniref:YLP motif-containing protein 1 n=1 Tax=Stephania cephalantha TaxID=152367 RepID=A0AAP0I0I1_9MAGN
MEDSWRFRPIQGTICPTCSISHFPFCHQNHQFNRFPNDPQFHRPVLDQFSENLGTPRPPMRPFSGNSGNSGDAYGMPQSLNRNQTLERDFSWQMPLPSFGYGGGEGFARGEFFERDGWHKRMRVGETGSGSGLVAQMPPPNAGYNVNPGRMSSDDERRLNLVRDHGASVSQANGYLNERLHGQHFTESSRGDWQPRFPGNAMMSSFIDPSFGSADRMGPALSRVHGFDPQQYAMQNNISDEKKEFQRGGHELGFGHYQMRANVRTDADSTVQYKGDGAGNVGPGQLIHDSLVVRGEGEHQDYASERENLKQYSGQQQIQPQNLEQANEHRCHVRQPFEVKHRFVDGNMAAVGPRKDICCLLSQMVPSPAKISSVYRVPPIMRFNSSANEDQPFLMKRPSPDKPKVVDASNLFLPPNRATRPDHIVIILRGLPGSGKSYLAKMLRDLEVENGGSAPRIHSMDDYFITEVEKVEEVDNSKSSSVVKGRPSTAETIDEYCYGMIFQEAYRSSMLKSFKKTLEEGNFTFVIVDDRNLRVADFAQFWASAKRSGYEVYLLEAMYKDPVGCAARNLHGFTVNDIKKMAQLWEEAPSLYLQLDVQSFFRGDNLKESEIQEVDMDMEDDVTCIEDSSELSHTNSPKIKESLVEDSTADGSFKDERWVAEGDDPDMVKELGRSKWSREEDEEVFKRPKSDIGNPNSLSSLIQAYSKEKKSVHWGDQVGKTGFSISAAKKASSLSLVIGPGAGYNLKSNPLPEEANAVTIEHGWGSKKRSVFEEQLRAERESFRAVFDRRRHRIGGLETEEE